MSSACEGEAHIIIISSSSSSCHPPVHLSTHWSHCVRLETATALQQAAAAHLPTLFHPLYIPSCHVMCMHRQGKPCILIVHQQYDSHVLGLQHQPLFFNNVCTMYSVMFFFERPSLC